MVKQPIQPSAGRSVLLAGATGLVGAEVLRQLLTDSSVSRIVVIGREPVTTNDARVATHVVDFNHLEAYAALFAVDQIICALGTTMRQAGSKEAFKRVDYDYPLAIARLGIARGARHFLVVSALGASLDSRFFYSRVKAELEEQLRSLGYRSTTIVRPSLLLGRRKPLQASARGLLNLLVERIGMAIGEFIPGQYRPVQASAVAQTLVNAARLDEPGLHIIESEEVRVGIA